MSLIKYVGKTAVILLILYLATKTVSSIKCYKCEGIGLLNISCAQNFSYKDCGVDKLGRTYNACFSQNLTNNFPVIGVTFTESKGCTFEGPECDLERANRCFNLSGFTLDCHLKCCIGDNCNLGSLASITSPISPTKRITETTGWIILADPSITTAQPTANVPSTTPNLPSTQTNDTESAGCKLRGGLYLLVIVPLITISVYI